MAKTATLNPGWRERLRTNWAEIDHYWFGFGSPTTLGLFRILMGFWNLVNLLLILVDFDAWYTERGFVPWALADRAEPTIARDFTVFGHIFVLPFSVPRINLLANVTDTRILLAFYLIIVVAAFLTTIGLWTRISSIILAIGIVTLQHRQVLILHGGDSVVRLAALYIAIAPSGAACSLDRLIGLWKGRITGPAPLVSLWPQRVIQFNLALIYFTTWWFKMDGTRWRNGTATYFPGKLHEFMRFPVPSFVDSPFMIRAATYGTLVTELSLGTLVFWKPARKWVLLAGLCMHGYIEYSMNIPLFAFSICSWYICFYRGEEVEAWARSLGARLKQWHLTLLLPRGRALRPEAAAVLQAVDPFHLVAIEPGDQEGWSAQAGDRCPKNPTRACLARCVGAWPLAFVPRAWNRVLERSTAP